MINPTPVTQEGLIYPGGYVPSAEMNDCYEELCVHSGNTHETSTVSIEEDGDSYRVEMAIPGVQRDELFIFVHDHIISISARPKDAAATVQQETPSGTGEWHIHLPRNADAEYICAEYRGGMLRLFIAKGRSGTHINNQQVMVY